MSTVPTTTPRLWQGPRHIEDAVRASAMNRHELEHDARPPWLPDDLAMPSEAMWNLLTCGDLTTKAKERHRDLWSVVLSMANCGWPYGCIKRALVDNAGMKGSPGEHWAALNNREARLRGMLDRARDYVRKNPANPELALPRDPQAQARVLQTLAAFQRAVLLDVKSASGAPFFATGGSGVTGRLVVHALIEHARCYASQLESERDGLSVHIAASVRCLALRLNLSAQCVSATLKSLRPRLSEKEAGVDPLLSLVVGGRPMDATTYALDLRVFPRNAQRLPDSTERPLTQVLPRRAMSTGVPLTAIQGPDLGLAAHDAFSPGGLGHTLDAPYGLTQALLFSLLVSNPDGLHAQDLARASGLTEPAIRKALHAATPSHARTANPHGVLESRRRGQPFVMALPRDELVERLDEVARKRGTAGLAAKRAAAIAEERAEFTTGDSVRSCIESFKAYQSPQLWANGKAHKAAAQQRRAK